MTNGYDSVTEHPAAMVRGQIPVAEVVEKIKRETKAEDMQAGEIPDLRMHRLNACHLPGNQILNITEEQLQIKAIRVPVTDTTKHYTEKDFVSMRHSTQDREEFIYLAYEEQVGYFYSNSNKLFLEAVLARGISENAIANQTAEYTCYRFYLQSYLEGRSAEPDLIC